MSQRPPPSRAGTLVLSGPTANGVGKRPVRQRKVTGAVILVLDVVLLYDVTARRGSAP
jgi:hypothetical protein